MVRAKIKKLLIELVNNRCEVCGKLFKNNDLHIHRIKRGRDGGTYEFRNCMVVCKSCHKKLHYKEF